LATAVLVLPIAALLAWSVARLGYWQDHPLVVGVPLLTGYSERAEAIAWFSFVLMCGALARIAQPFIPLTVARWPVPLFGLFVALTVWVGERWCVPIVVFLFWFSIEAPRWLDRLGPQSQVLLALSLGIFGWTVVASGEWDRVALGLSGLLVVLALFPIRTWVLPPLTVVVLGFCFAVEEHLRWVLVGSFLAVVMLSGLERNSIHRGILTLVALGCFVYATPFWDERTIVERLAGMIQASTTGFLFLHWWRRIGSSQLPLPVQECSRRHGITCVVVGLLLGLALYRPWFGGVLLAVVGVLLLAGPRADRRGWLAVVSLAGVLLAVLPRATVTNVVDGFHDGQIISAVWQWEQGERLYCDVFPLRSVEFWLAWVGRRIFPDSVSMYQWMQTAPAFLAVFGVGWASFAATHSALCGVASAMIALQWGRFDFRAGLACFLLGCILITLRQHFVVRWMGLTLLGIFGGLSGFDLLVPLMMATILGEAFAPASAGIRFQRMGTALLLITLPWTIVLAMTQGWDSAWEFWRLLHDFASDYPAFYGLPLPWSDGEHSRWLITGMLSVGTWAVTGPAGCRGARDAERTWATLLIFPVFYFMRGIGRSDASHIDCVFYPTVVLALTFSWNALRRPPVRWRRGGALAAVAMGAWFTPMNSTNPMQVLDQFHDIQRHPEPWPQPDPWIQARTPPSAPLWDIEDGMLPFIEHRRNPTRHALAYCIGTPREQQRALDDLRRTPPAVVRWKFLSGTDGIANPLRYHRMMDWILRNYHPSDHFPFLVPVPTPWAGDEMIPDWAIGPMSLGMLPSRWGKDRAAEFQPLPKHELTFEHKTEYWWADVPVDPRKWNYLVAHISMAASDSKDAAFRLEIESPERRWTDFYELTWKSSGEGDGKFVIPIGLHPGWTWRKSVTRLRISSPGGTITSLQAHLVSKADD
jgi:hypothetical protein